MEKKEESVGGVLLGGESGYGRDGEVASVDAGNGFDFRIPCRHRGPQSGRQVRSFGVFEPEDPLLIGLKIIDRQFVLYV